MQVGLGFKPRKKLTFQWNYKATNNLELLLLTIPAILIIFIFNYIPMYGVQIAFKDFVPIKGILGSPWVGLKQFERFFNLYNSWTIIKNTIIISVYNLCMGFPAPVLLALLLNQLRNERFKRVVQTITYMPHFISTVVIVGMIDIFLSPQTGFYGQIAQMLGFKAYNFLADSGKFSTIYVLSEIWQHTGWNSIIYLAALSTVDVEIYEASIVDGANKWQRMINIDLPSLVPTAVILLILSIGSIMSVGFDKVYLMQNNLNLSASEVISTYVYKIGIQQAHYSFSAAVNLFNTIVNFLLLLGVNRLASRFSETSLW